jgi:hypothetical protein
LASWNQAARMEIRRNVAPHYFKQDLNAAGSIKPLQYPELASKRTGNKSHTVTWCNIRTI